MIARTRLDVTFYVHYCLVFLVAAISTSFCLRKWVSLRKPKGELFTHMQRMNQSRNRSCCSRQLNRTLGFQRL